MHKSITKNQIKHIRLLHQKKYRQKYSQFFVEGSKSVSEFLNSKFKIQNVFATYEWQDKNMSSFYKQFEIILVSNSEMQQISMLKNPPGVLGVFEQLKVQEININENIVLALQDIRDPGNMGTIIRTADWFGLKQILCSTSCAEAYNPKVIQASMGSLARVHVIYTDLLDLKKSFPNHRMVLADMKGKNMANYKWDKNILVIGNEANGVSQFLKNKTDDIITIPRIGKAESLNAAMSVGIILAFARLK